MQNKFFFNTARCFLYIGIFLFSVTFSQFFSGCSGSDDEEVVDQRSVDSIEVYTNLQKSFALYKKALTYNESSNDKRASESFESALKHLNDLKYELVLKPGNYFWKQDYDELAKSIVQDYLITQGEISSTSMVFDFARRIPVTFEKVEQVKGDREPLPDGSEIPLVRNSAVDEYIEFFSNTDRGRTFVDKCLYRSGKYFPLMRKILKFNNAPEELIYLSVQESGLNPTIVSRAGAVGLWQFMPATGYAYGLSQDEYRDDRRDFEKSTDAAARHLKDLYRTFDDWYLAFSAYNAGPGRVNSAIRKSGSNDFWSLRGYLPGETKNYVPSIIALSFVLRNPGEYGFNNIEYGTPVSYDRVNVKTSMSLQKVAELSETDIETIRDLNPEITNDMLPSYYDVSYQLRIPDKSYNKFASNYEKASDIDKSNNFTPEFAGNETGGFGKTIEYSYYKVQNYEPGDTRRIGSKIDKKRVGHEFDIKQPLNAIAVYYEVRPVEIRLWNNLAYGSFPDSKQILDIYISKDKYKSLYGINVEPAVENKITEQKPELQSITGAEEIRENPTAITKEQPGLNSVENTIPDTITENINTSENPVVTNETPVETTILQSTTTEPETTVIPETATELHVPEPEIVSSKKNTNNTRVYIVSEGDYLSVIAKDQGVSLNDLMEWNELENDKIMVGQKLRMYPVSSNATVHTVQAGENLSMIAKQYGISLAELAELNNIENDKILIGQKLRISGNAVKNKNITKTSGVKKSYKVKRGETLASIANDHGMSVTELIEWNNLKSDKIIIGQVLKLYKEDQKKKVRKRKN